MKHVKYIIGIVLVAVVVGLIGRQVGRFRAEQQLRQQTYNTQTDNNVIPVSALPPYEYTNCPSANPDSPEYISEEDGFAARFPATVKVTNYGGMMKTHYAAEIEGEGAYNIMVNSYGRPFLGDKAVQAGLQGHLEGRLQLFGENARLIRNRQVVFLGHTALDYEYAVNSNGIVAYFKGVYFFWANLGYGVSVVCTEETKAAAYTKYADFVKSFRLTKGHKR